MSALLAHAKMLHAVASGFQREANAQEGINNRTLLFAISRALTTAADDLGDQIRREVSPVEESPIKPGVRIPR